MRDGFLKMINDGVNGLIDIVLTKSISRFSRNLVDTLHGVLLNCRSGLCLRGSFWEKGLLTYFKNESMLRQELSAWQKVVIRLPLTKLLRKK